MCISPEYVHEMREFKAGLRLRDMHPLPPRSEFEALYNFLNKKGMESATNQIREVVRKHLIMDSFWLDG